MRWTLTLDQTVVDTAIGLGITSIAVSDAELVAGVLEGASGPDHVARPPARTLDLAAPPTFTEGPFAATFTRTGEVGDPITVAAKNVFLVATIDLGGPIPLSLACTPGAGASFTLSDVEGATPDPTTTPSSSTAATVAGAQTTRSLPRTGLDLMWPLIVALILIDFGLLADAYSPSPRGPRRRMRQT